MSETQYYELAQIRRQELRLYERRGYRRAPEFDVDVNAHYGIASTRPWTALGYLKSLSAAHAA